MAELGVVSAIIGIACLGVNLSKTLYTCSSNAINADHNINRIATNITLFSSMLKHVGRVMGDSKSLHTPEAVETAMQIVHECEKVFAEVGKMVSTSAEGSGSFDGESAAGERRTRRRISIMQRVRWHFEQPKVEWLLAQLEYLKTTLSVLIQTLNLAAITAQAKETSKLEEKRGQIQQERLHIETLIIARQLSIIILKEFGTAQHTNGFESSGRFSPVESEATIDSRAPKLLREESESSASALSLIRLGRGHFEFLDQAMPDEDEAFSPTSTRPHDQVIDVLLDRWTKMPDVDVGVDKKYQRDVDLEPQVMLDSKGSTLRSSPAPMSPPLSKTVEPDSEIRFSALREDEANSAITLVASPASQMKQPLSASLGPPKGGHRTPSPRLRRSQPRPSLSVDHANVQANSKVSLLRTMSSPESQPPVNNQLQPGPLPLDSRAMPGSAQLGLQPLSVYPPPPTLASRPPLSPISSPQAATSVDFQSQRPTTRVPQSRPQPNPYAARVSPGSSRSSSRSSSPSSTISSDEEYTPPRRIRWTIRIGSKHWEFTDEQLVGPKTPHLPTEPMSYLHSHDYAYTEISNGWVFEEAIAERQYPYKRILPGEPGYEAHGAWRILCPLRFKDIEALHERTGEIWRKRNAAAAAATSTNISSNPRPNQAARAFSVPSNPYAAGNPLPPNPIPSFGNTGQGSFQSNNIPQWQPQQQQPLNTTAPQRPAQHQGRTVSFEVPPLQQPHRSNSLRPGSSDRSPRGSGDYSAAGFPPQQQQQQQTGGYWIPQGQGPVPGQSHMGGVNAPPQMMQFAAAGTPGAPPLPSQYQPVAPPRGQWSNGQWFEYPRHEEEYRERDGWRERDREWERGERSREREREYEREERRRERRAERERERKKKKTKAGAAAAGTLGGIGGLAALLEGLDGL